MSSETDTALRKSLDAIDSMRRRIHGVGWLVVVLTFGAYAHLAWVQRVSDNLERVLSAAVLAVTCLVAWATFAVVLVVVRMARRILHAIDLASRGQLADGGEGLTSRNR